MKFNRIFTTVGAAVCVFIAGIINAAAQPASNVATAPMYVPDYSHANEPLPDGVIAWDALFKSVDATEGDDFARFTFDFTNIATHAEVILTTNTGNSVTSTTNITPASVTILNVHPSCGCTTAELPPTPWIIPPGSNGEIKLSINLAGKQGMLTKTVNISTDHGSKTLTLRVNLQARVITPMTDDQKMAGIAAAKIDRQAVFKGDCATCHVAKNITGLYGEQLFKSVCAICHEAENRATMVPDLHKLNLPTNQDFWRTWATFGKPGSLMPAFATSQGGPLSDMQIASLAAYLDVSHPSLVTNSVAH